MNYLVIDLEMCNVPKHYRGVRYPYANEIIQVGAVLLDENFERIATMDQYVRPVHGVLDNFITELTGIENSQLKHAPLLEEALLHMLDWLGDREYKVYEWSNTDRSQLKHEITVKHIEDDRIDDFLQPERWVDYQKAYGKRFGFERAVSLEHALISCDIDQEGRLHNGLDDALNTGKLIRLLETNPEFELITTEWETQEEGLKFTLGDLLAGFSFD